MFYRLKWGLICLHLNLHYCELSLLIIMEN